MMKYNRLTDYELSEFLQRACVQLVPELTQQLLSVGTELTEYRNKYPAGAPDENGCTYQKCVEFDFTWWECDKCKTAFTFNAGNPYGNRFHYCPYCGAKIIECKELQNGLRKSQVAKRR